MMIHEPVLALAWALLAAPVAVQEGSKEEGVGTGALVYARATGPFARNVKDAIGLTVTAHHNIDRRGFLAFGLEGTYLLYDYDMWNVGAVNELEAKSHIATLGLGPQLRARLGVLEPYVSASAGAALFLTGSCVLDGWSYPQEECTESFHAVHLAFPAYTVGGGLRIRLTQGTQPISLDLGARYQATPLVRYVPQGGVEWVRDDRARLNTARTRTALWLFYAGVSMSM